MFTGIITAVDIGQIEVWDFDTNPWMPDGYEINGTTVTLFAENFGFVPPVFYIEWFGPAFFDENGVPLPPMGISFPPSCPV